MSPDPQPTVSTALVTGASAGIGRAIAVRLAREGLRVLLTARRAGDLAATAEAVTRAGGTAAVFCADMSQRASTDALAAWVRTNCASLTALVHNAGLGGPSPLGAAGTAEFDRRLEVNLVAPMRLTRALHDLLPRDGTGRIVMIASVLARFGVPDYHGYCASKAGLVGFARALARDLAPEKITVNAVCPGWVRTDMAAASFARLGSRMQADAAAAEVAAMKAVPLGRVLEPAEIADLVAWLVSPGAAAMTGQAINHDGGVLA